MLLTDGADDDNVAGSLNLDAALTNLKSTCGKPTKPVQVVTIGLGIDSDFGDLREISAATASAVLLAAARSTSARSCLAAIFD